MFPTMCLTLRFRWPTATLKKYQQMGFDDKTAAVYGMIENMDENIGRLLRALDTLEQTNNTIVVFLTDNGPNGHRYNGDMKGIKASVDEGGVRVPCFIRYPDRLTGDTTVTTLAAHIDMLPTLVELAGLIVPDTLALDGTSLLPRLEGTGTDWPPRTLFTHYSGKSVTPQPGGVRTEKYRLVLPRDGEPQLYDMLHDPEQTHDIARQQPETVDTLVEQYRNWYAQVTQDLEELPVSIGYPEAPTTVLPAHEASLIGDVQYRFKNGYTNDWITHWTSREDTIRWSVKVVRAGEYAVFMEYACAAEDTGAVVSVEIDNQLATRKIDQPFPLETISVPNRTPPGNHVDARWNKIQVGRVRLDTGTYSLALRATRIAGQEVAQLKALRMVLAQ